MQNTICTNRQTPVILRRNVWYFVRCALAIPAFILCGFLLFRITHEIGIGFEIIDMAIVWFTTAGVALFVYVLLCGITWKVEFDGETLTKTERHLFDVDQLSVLITDPVKFVFDNDDKIPRLRVLYKGHAVMAIATDNMGQLEPLLWRMKEAGVKIEDRANLFGEEAKTFPDV